MNKFCLCLLLLLLSFGVEAKESSNENPKRVEITATSPLASQMRYADTYYVIKDIIDLKGKSAIIPRAASFVLMGDNCLMEQLKEMTPT